MTSSPSPSSSYEVDSAALLKILLHAAKHPSSDVLGVLVGRPPKAASSSGGAAAAGDDADGVDAVESTSTPSVSGRVVDALPLFHESVGLTPMLEVALLQAAAHAKSRNLSLLGVYAANEHLGDTRLKHWARAAAEAVARGNSSGSNGGGGAPPSPSPSPASSSCILLVNNAALPSFSEGRADAEAGDVLSLWLRNNGAGANGGWERAAASPSSPAAPLLRGGGGDERAELFVQAVAKGLADQVSDFDDHLLDPKKDWLNPGLLG